MKSIHFVLVLAAGFCATSSHAVWDTGPHDAGLLYLRISNYARFGYENQGIWPKGSGEYYIFGAGIWAGALLASPEDTTSLTASIDDIASTIEVASTDLFDSIGVFVVNEELVHYAGKTATSFLQCIRGFAGSEAVSHGAGAPVERRIVQVTVGYNPSNGASEFVPGDLPNEPGYTDTLDRIYFTDDPADTAVWPIRDPYGNPIIISSQDSYAIANDQDSTRHEVGGSPLNIRITQIGYSWHFHYYEDFVFLTYWVVNDNPDSLLNMYLSLCCDADIGDATDDSVGFDEERNLGYALDSDGYEPGWIHTPGYVGFDFLESPLGPGGGELGLTAFKIVHNPMYPDDPGEEDPSNDDQAYQLIAGYNYSEGIYHPTDTVYTPTDIRFLQCTGPFDLAPGDTATVVIAVICGSDFDDLQANSDLAQNLYNIDFITDWVHVLSPNGGEEVSGIVPIAWEDSSAVGAPLWVDISYSHDGGQSWTDIVTNMEDPEDKSYDWDTEMGPDGTRCLVRITVHDTLAVGEDVSDTVFTVNNPGNGVPDVLFLAPDGGDVTGTAEVRWWAADADGDSLRMDLLASEDNEYWIALAEDEQNDGSWIWNTYRLHNGNYHLMVIAHDADTFAADTSERTVAVLNDHRLVAEVVHTAGACDALNLLALEYHRGKLTDHTYEVSFRSIEPAGGGQPLYSYDLRDLTTSELLLEGQELTARIDGALYVDHSPTVDGFGLEADTQIDGDAFRFIDFQVVENQSGFNGELQIFGEDSLGTAPPLVSDRWAFRGSDFEILWKAMEDDTSQLTLEIWDRSNEVLVPYAGSRGDNWHFISPAGEIYDPETHNGFYLCGGMFFFDRQGTMTVPPGSGDVWEVRSSGPQVPCSGNVYIFTPTVGCQEGTSDPSDGWYSSLRQNFPNPFAAQTTIVYSVAGLSTSGQKTTVRLSIFDVAGRRVSMLADGPHNPGRYAVCWDGKESSGETAASGIYFCRLEVADPHFVSTVKMVVLR